MNSVVLPTQQRTYQPAIRDTGSLIYFAWAFEIFGVVLGIGNSVSITFAREFPTTLYGWLPALPLAVLAAFELLRIPLAKAFQTKQRFLPRLFALVAIVSLVGIAFENWSFGLERTVNERLATVEPLRTALRQAQDDVANALSDSTTRADQMERDRNAIQKSIENNERQLQSINERLAAEDATHATNQAGIDRFCLKIPGPCGIPRSKTELKRYNAAKEQLLAERRQVAQNLENSTNALRGPAAVNDDGRLAALRRAEAATYKAFAREVSSNPIFRIASAVFGVAPEKITDEQLATARAFFVMFSAAIISITGTLAALIYYWPDRSTRSSKLTAAARAYLARLRRKVVRVEKVEISVEKVVEKIVEKIVPEVEKPILIEKTVIRFVPYTGNGSLPEDETSVKRVEGHPAEAALSAARANNASHLRVYK